LKLAGASGVALATGVRPGMAQDFPSKPITIIVPYAPGATDREARVIATVLEREFKQPVQVDNRPGGGATIGSNVVARANPDGYTLLYVASIPVTVSPYIRTLPYTFEDFTPIAQGTQGTHLVVARADAPFGNLAEMLAYAKAHPGEVSIGNSGGTGGATHLANEAMAAAAGIELNHIPFEGLSQSVAALLGGVLDLATGLPVALTPQIESGRIKPIAQMGAERSPLMPDVPTLKEASVDLDLNVTLGLYGPKDMPPALVEQLAAGMKTAIESPEFKDYAQTVKTVPMYRGPADFKAAIDPERKLFSALIPQLGIKVE
jgi:tripartite-type tricarboxylate transporter receptor subunit TctC